MFTVSRQTSPSLLDSPNVAQRARTERTQEAAIAPTARKETPFLPNRGANASKPAASKGKKGINQSMWTTSFKANGRACSMTGFRLALQFVDFFRIGRAMMPIDGDNQRQPNGGFSGGNGNGEQNEQQSVQ